MHDVLQHATIDRLSTKETRGSLQGGYQTSFKGFNHLHTKRQVRQGCTKGWVRTETAKAEAQWTTGHAFQGE
jgi:hypothetical protein